MYSSFRFARLPRLATKVRYRSPAARYLLITTSIAIAGAKTSTLYNDTLKCDKTGDTFEMGLYITSTKELETARNGLLHEESVSKSTIKRFLVKAYYRLRDNIIEPIHTVLRFFKLSMIFLPLLVAYPITYFGHTVTISRTGLSVKSTSGSLLWYRLFRKALELAGPSFTKLGQWAGARTDIFPEGLCLELGNLHSNAKPHALSYTKKQIVESLGVDSFDDVFEEFVEDPIGCGAIAQVYVGKVKEKLIAERNLDLGPEGNRWCAVKVVHPNAPKEISRDLKIMTFFARAINALPHMEWLSLPEEVEQFSILMKMQLDLRIECHNLEKFNKHFAKSIDTKFPRGFFELTSRRVLFEEYVHALSMETFLRVKNDLDQELSKSVSDPFTHLFLQMMILDNFIHSDLHAGNVFIRFVKTDKKKTKVLSSESETFQVVDKLRMMYKNNDPKFVETLSQVLTEYTPQLCIIDVGLVTELNERNRVNFMALFNALARFDGYRAGELMIERSRTPETAIEKEVFSTKVEHLVKKVKQSAFTLGSVSIGDLLHQVLTMVRTHHVKMEGDFVSVVVAIMLLEGIGRQLDPELDLFASSLPLLREYGLRRENQAFSANDQWSMIKVWIGLEVLHFMSLSVNQINDLVKSDQLCPSY
ncbi:HCL517Cp [Eremothecium sinecaudum]|uniref:HCL517Cp n=1 Tax=Eremothecium sinecaudum TaxID=45286 RepID=A0A120K1Q6_9SACH|nr:HCL517Cp [Eremothecium sinecaudum]AMD19634.1 HCL517Cp [Eremothecium sinecaudum]